MYIAPFRIPASRGKLTRTAKTANKVYPVKSVKGILPVLSLEPALVSRFDPVLLAEYSPVAGQRPHWEYIAVEKRPDPLDWIFQIYDHPCPVHPSSTRC